ncbi:substrate-binding periplasmic protein [Photobacterium sp. TY1-4]|uniref:substrate-binding periplasmic protein n=1 Tax=Photobacterium sp. TY1-4 TaxID=2899122 RepID=UPI0021C003B2|nr:transporter substrate-binding domain-containing protein [Photobacterium sp. TY1-4]UXI03571.1 transporter substrate-binding domain-containing protein [Photobacterium sp. TY1-4]
MSTQTATSLKPFFPASARLCCAMVIVSALSVPDSQAAQDTLKIAIANDMPPYVMDNANNGLEVDVVKQALADYDIQFVQVSYRDLQSAVQQQGVDAAIGVMADDSGVFYSDNLITFANFAISKKADQLTIHTIDDLKKHPVLTWQNAYTELGGAFESLFSPVSEYRSNYREFSNQADQVSQFWKENGQVAVIDRNIFAYFTKALGHPLNEVTYHNLFPAVTHFRAGFKDEAVMKAFNAKLSDMCQSGTYAKLLEQHHVTLARTVCDDQ